MVPTACKFFKGGTKLFNSAALVLSKNSEQRRDSRKDTNV